MKVEIFVPLSICACRWDGFMNSVFNALTPYIKYIDFETKDIESDEAKERSIYKNCVLIDKEQRFTSSFNLKRALPKMLEKKGLI